MALDLTNDKPFASSAFSLGATTDRAGFTFDPTFDSDLNDLDLSALNLSDSTISKAFAASAIAMPALTGGSGASTGGGMGNSGIGVSTGNIDTMGNLLLLNSKRVGDKQFQYGWGLKTAASAGKLFTQLLTYGSSLDIANKTAQNTKLQAANEMAALDNQVLYYKNQITDKFNTLLARNTVTMAAKNLRVTAGALLESTKDAAYDATKDIQMLESNAELKKIALRSQQKQADIAKKLQKNLLTANLIKGVADLGLTISTANASGMKYGDLFSGIFSGDKGDLNKMVYWDSKENYVEGDLNATIYGS